MPLCSEFDAGHLVARKDWIASTELWPTAFGVCSGPGLAAKLASFSGRLGELHQEGC